ncbi:ABC transporter substrate-binding protein [Heliomicrobium undosum]|nr:MetQ/NlpA family ABC transporter substrate-binding protein [Heliomicrobium undosum]
MFEQAKPIRNRRIRMLTVALAALFTLQALLITGCGKSGNPQAAPGPNGAQAPSVAAAGPVKLGILPIEDNLPFYVAEQEGLFKARGVDVTLVPFSSAQERDAAMQAGQIDGEVADLVAVALLQKSGTPVKVAAVGLGVNAKEGRFALLASPKSAVRQVSDLKNAQVAISENSIIEFVGDQILAEGGLRPADVKKMAIPKIPVRLQMLLSDQITAAILPDPLAFLAERQGAKLIADDTQKNISQTVLLFRKDSVEKNREAIQKVVAVYGEAGQALTADPAKFRPLVVAKANIPKEIQDSYQSPTFSKPVPPSREDLARVMDWMAAKKLLEKPYAYEDLVDPSLAP